jgi:hypothetical protein
MLGNSLQLGAEAWNFGEEKRLSHGMSFMCETAANQHRVKTKQKTKGAGGMFLNRSLNTPSIRGKLSPLTVKSGSCNDVYLWLEVTVLYRTKS